MNNDGENSLTVLIGSRDKKNIMFGGNTKLAEINEKNSDTLEIPFTVPQGGSLVDIRITNNSEKSKVLIDNAKIIDGKTGKSVKNVKLQYKFIPNSVASRFENLIGFQMFKDNWLIGAGGGAWPSLVFAYQSYPYWSTQSHAYFLQVANCCTVYYGI